MRGKKIDLWKIEITASCHEVRFLGLEFDFVFLMINDERTLNEEKTFARLVKNSLFLGFDGGYFFQSRMDLYRFFPSFLIRTLKSSIYRTFYRIQHLFIFQRKREVHCSNESVLVQCQTQIRSDFKYAMNWKSTHSEKVAICLIFPVSQPVPIPANDDEPEQHKKNEQRINYIATSIILNSLPLGFCSVCIILIYYGFVLIYTGIVRLFWSLCLADYREISGRIFSARFK